MGTEKGLGNGQVYTIAGGIIAIISAFLPWFSAKLTAGSDVMSSISVNGLGSISGSGTLLNLVSGKVDWEFQGLGVLALGIACIGVVVLLREKIQGMAMSVCGVLIIGGGLVNLWSLRDVGSFSGELFGGTMESGVGYGLYVVILAGAIAAAGGFLAWRGR